jgi:hypothetical protein
MHYGKVLVNNVAQLGKMRVICGNKGDPVALAFVFISKAFLTGDGNCFGDLRVNDFSVVFTSFKMLSKFSGTMLQGSI